MTYEVMNEYGDLLGWIAADRAWVERKRFVSFTVGQPFSVTVNAYPETLKPVDCHRLDLRVEQFYNAGAQPRVALVVEERLSGWLAQIPRFKPYQ